MDKTCFGISLGTLAETLCGADFTAGQLLTILQRRENMAKLILLLVVVLRLAIDFDKTIEFYDLALGHELLICATDIDIDCGLLYFCICHLTGNGAFPYEFIQTLLLCSTLNLRLIHIGRTDSLVSLLRTFGTGVVLAGLAVLTTIEFDNLLLAGTKTEL